MKTMFLFLILGFAANLQALSCWFQEIRLDTLAPGIVEVKGCINAACDEFTLDTVSERELMDTLEVKYNSNNYCAIGHISEAADVAFGGCYTDSVTGAVICPAYPLPESVLVVFDTLLKGQMPGDRLWYLAHRGSIWDNRYSDLKDKTFLAFFNAYDSIQQLGFYPIRACEREATGYFIVNNKIMGTGNKGMPGISVSLNDFMNQIPVERTVDGLDFGFSIHPNPVCDVVTVSIVGDYPAKHVDLKLFDLRGRLVSEMPSAALQKPGGINGSQWNVGGLPNGIYLLRARFDDKYMAKKLFLQR